MRITEEEKSAFIEILSSYDFAGELKLYGSRADNNAKGGDIDLLLLVETQTQRKQLASHKHEILADIKLKVGDQKIDLLISTYETAKTDTFIQLVLPESLLLYRWHINQQPSYF